ncbi:MAG: VOC family protein [Sporichthyaceae bacterium]
MAVNPIPDGYPSVSPYLVIDGAAEAIAFYVAVLGATERMRMPGPGGSIGHAEVEIGSSVVMLADVSDMSGPDPKKLGGSPVTLMVYVPDCDATYQAAVDAGAESISKPEDQFYGDRSAAFTDPFGHKWNLHTHVEDVSEEEMGRRMQALMAG